MPWRLFNSKSLLGSLSTINDESMSKSVDLIASKSGNKKV